MAHRMKPITEHVGPMKLRYTPLSPFARKVRVFALEVGLGSKLELSPCDVWAPDCDIVQDNPLGKVPVLLTEEGAFVGSMMCCMYLDSLHDGQSLIPKAGPGHWRSHQLEALADGVMEAAVAHVTERLRRPERFVYPGWLARQEDKIRRTLDVIEADHDLPAAVVTLPAITLGCALAYLDIRLPKLDWRQGRPRLASWLRAFDTRPSMEATHPEVG